MKNLLFSLLLIGGVVPNISFALTAKEIIQIEEDRIKWEEQDAKPPSTEEAATAPTQTPVERSPIKTEEEMRAQRRNDTASLGLTEAQRIESRTGINPTNANLRIPTDTPQTNKTDKNSTNIPFLDQIVSPDTAGFGGKDQPLSRLLNQLFWVGLVGAVILAVIMIIRGGIEYMTIDSIDGKSRGKSRVQAALGGLLLAFSTILILNTINPGLTKLKITFPRLQEVKPVTLVGGLQSGTRTGTDTNGNPIYTPPTSSGGNGINPLTTAYSPQKNGDKMEGGYASSKPGLDGQFLVRTLDDYAKGRSPYLTLAGDPNLYGNSYTIPQITYVNSSGQTVSLTNVIGYVHDTGSAFTGKGTSKIDIPVGKDYSSNSLDEQPFSNQNIQFIPLK